MSGRTRPASKDLLRVVDANANRAVEALRVLEDVSRFLLRDAAATRALRSIRHQIPKTLERGALGPEIRYPHRDVGADFGKDPDSLEKTRSGVRGLFLANAQRAKESLRVLEETSKLLDRDSWKAFKTLRFKLYELEPKILAKLPALRHR